MTKCKMYSNHQNLINILVICQYYRLVVQEHKQMYFKSIWTSANALKMVKRRTSKPPFFPEPAVVLPNYPICDCRKESSRTTMNCRTYGLPALEGGNKHPSLRSISCETLATLIRGKFSHTINSFR